LREKSSENSKNYNGPGEKFLRYRVIFEVLEFEFESIRRKILELIRESPRIMAVQPVLGRLEEANDGEWLREGGLTSVAVVMLSRKRK